MKKGLGIALLAACMSLAGMGLEAKAVDVKVSGEWDFAMGWVVDGQFLKDERADDNFSASQRFRTQIEFIASEQLRGVVMFEIGTIVWGSNDGDDGGGGTAGRGVGGRLDADGVNVETKRAYLDWMVPETDLAIRMGIQGFSLPMGNGWSNPVFSADVAGVVANYKFDDMFGLTAWWLRPFDSNLNDGNGRSLNDEMDIVGMALPVTGEGWSVTPWGMYAWIGNASGYMDYMWDVEDHTFGSYDDESTHGIWLGLSFEASAFDPLSFSVDAMYGKISNTSMGVWHTDTDPATWDGWWDFETEGYFVAAALNYSLDWGTPGIYGWYGSGDDADAVKNGEFGRMPVVGVDDGFGATSFGFPGSAGIGADTAISATGMGTWGVAVQLADVTFVENLSHTLRLAYYRGTNNSENVTRIGGIADYIPTTAAETFYLTHRDYAWEINVDHSYKIYENLTAIVETAYIDLNLSEDVWQDNSTDGAWKAQLLMQYSF